MRPSLSPARKGTFDLILHPFRLLHLDHFPSHVRSIKNAASLCCLTRATQHSSSVPRQHPLNMGMKYRRYLAGERIYGCSKCKTHLATIHSMISRVSVPGVSPASPLSVPKAFNGQHGRAYLFDGV